MRAKENLPSRRSLCLNSLNLIDGYRYVLTFETLIEMQLAFITEINNCIAKVEVGCLEYPGASTIGSQPLD